jgi:hypothetical protein
MKLPLQLTLALSCISLVITAIAAFTFYVDWKSKYPSVETPPSQHIATAGIADRIAASQNLDSVKAACLSLAKNHDTSMADNKSMYLTMNKIYDGAILFALGFGLISSAGFLYLHFLLRRLSREIASRNP